MEEDLISIIVPVYNVEKYIRECIDSIIKQTYHNIELILIDDGSTDNSAKICDEYATKDKRIKVIHKENRGVSSARNIGLDNANGQYITFIDSDDYVKNNYCEELLKNLKDKNADCVACGYNRIYKNKEEKVVSKNAYALDSLGFLQNIMSIQNGLGFCHMKLWKKSSIMDIRFDETLKVGEDSFFNMKVSQNIKKFYMLNQALYCYRFNENSVVRKYDENYVKKYLESMQLSKKYIEEHYKDNEILLKKMNNYIVYHVLLVIVNYCTNPNKKLNNKNQLKEIKKVCNIQEFKEAIKNSDYEGFSFTRKVTLFTLKYKLYLITLLIGKIRQIQFKKRNDLDIKETLKSNKEEQKITKKEKKFFNSDIIFQIAIASLPFENFFFAPSIGWATITPIILVLYLVLNIKLLINELLKFKKIVIFFIVGILLSFINYLIVGIEFINIINALITLGLGFVILFSFDIYYSKTYEIKKVIKILFVSYTISIAFGILQFIAIKLDVKFLYHFFDFIFKRNYLQYNRIQYFFTEPSFIGMHIFGILLPIYFISKDKKILYLIIAFCISAFIFASGVRILLDITTVGVILLFDYLIRNKKYHYILIIPITGIIAVMVLYNSNYRIKQIIDEGIYTDGSLASRYFRIQSTIYGYTKKPIHALFGYGLGNSILPLRDGYNDAIISYKSSYIGEVRMLGNPNYTDDSVSYCLYIRFLSEFGLILLVVAGMYIYEITKNSSLKYKYSYLFIILYLYLQFESYAFYAIWLFILIMTYTKNTEKKETKQ